MEDPDHKKTQLEEDIDELFTPDEDDSKEEEEEEPEEA